MHSAGWLESGRSSPVTRSSSTDVELLRVGLPRLRAAGSTSDEESLAFSAHQEVGQGGHFLGAVHTLERFRECFYRPLVSSTENDERWKKQRRPRRGRARRRDLARRRSRSTSSRRSTTAIRTSTRGVRRRGDVPSWATETLEAVTVQVDTVRSVEVPTRMVHGPRCRRPPRRGLPRARCTQTAPRHRQGSRRRGARRARPRAARRPRPLRRRSPEPRHRARRRRQRPPTATQGCDGLVALGGGSSIDAAKGIGVEIVHGGSILDYEYGGVPIDAGGCRRLSPCRRRPAPGAR